MTRNPGARRRGEPLAALILLTAGWIGLRVAVWETPFPVHRLVSPPIPIAQPPVAVRLPQQLPTGGVDKGALSPQSSVVTALPAFRFAESQPLRGPREALIRQWPPAATITPIPLKDGESLAAASTRAPFNTTPPFILTPPVPDRKSTSRWHLSAWAAWRQGSGLPRLANGPAPAAYGGSQIGAVGEVDLASGPQRPAAHVRVTYAPDRPQQREAALGLGARPVAQVPVRAIAEVRATQIGGTTEVRPAAFAVTEAPPIVLPGGLTGEGYAQAGWVGGRYATAFADGQLRVTRLLTREGRLRASVGAGAWGGAQNFAQRLDVGPTLTIDLAPVRLSLDYRFKVAGNAAPGNGAAVTLSTGF